MYCPNCRTVVPDGTKFCPECGAQIYQSANTAQGQQQASANYAQGQASKASIFSKPVELKRSKKAEEKKKSITQKPWFIIVLIIIIVAAVKSRGSGSGSNSTSRSSSNDRTTPVVATEAHTAVTRAVPKESTGSKTTETARVREATTAEKAQETEATASSDTILDQSIIRPEIKEAIDSYEEYVDSYCAFMESYDASDASQLAAYLALLQDEIEMTERFDAMEDEELTDAELDYYAAVGLRCSQKIIACAYTIN